MNVAIAYDNYGSLSAYRFSDTGVSYDSRALKEILDGVDGHFHQSVTGQRIDSALEELDELFQRCSVPGWDGYGAAPISQDAYFEAAKFLKMLPPSGPLPEIVGEPTGEIALEWYMGKHFVFVVSVAGNRTITYAGMFGKGNETHGTENFAHVLPSVVVRNIRRLISGR